MTTPFDRTTCACPTDVENCRTAPGHMIPDDAERILDVLGARGESTDPTQWFEATKGALVGDRLTGTRMRIGTIGPQRRADGRCVFLTPDDRCSIHAVAPFGCAYFDAHMSREEGDRRSLWGLREIQRSFPYQLLRKQLVEAGKLGVRIAFTAVVEEGFLPFGVGEAREGVPGYKVVSEYRFKTYAEAMAVAKQLNSELGLGDEDVVRIVLSSMAAERRNKKHGKRR